MENVVSIFPQKKTFSVDEVRELLPLVLHVTAEAQREVSKMMNRLEAIKYGSSEAAANLEVEIQNEINTWQNKLTRLGARPKGLWLADFDNGTGYYCWKYPESDVRFWHGYQDGFSGRQPLLTEG